MTCAHIVNVALNKLPGVESVNVSLNDKSVSVKLKPGNTVSIPQLWQLFREKGYTPKETALSARGNLANLQGHLQLTVSGTNQVLSLVGDPKNAAALSAASGKTGQTVVVRGVMLPGKDLKAPVPLQVSQVK